ncbi:MAG: L,D-transpeptidase family protein [Nitrospirota bacterium]|nr:L,D-transpeptidase family protein [Nitrospirota bacterium]
MRLWQNKLRIVSLIILIAFWAQSFLWPEKAFATFAQADKVVVIKSKRLMMLLQNGEILKTYRISLGKQPIGRKNREGDNKTPEGSYILNSKNTKSKYHLSIMISYPNESDILKAQERGVSPGGSIMIHGLSEGLESLGKLHRALDWTNGCIAVTNSEIEEIWQLVSDGTPIEIKP